MTRALVLLTCGALLTLVVEVTDTFRRPWQEPWALVLAGAFTLVATVGFAWVRGRGRAWAAAYVAGQLVLGMVMFGAAHLEVGATLLMVVLVMQAVVLLGLPAGVVVAAVVPLGHLGMSAPEGLRAGLGTLAAVVFGLVLAELLVREQRARDQLAEAHAQLRGYAAQAEQLATTQERNRLARDIHDGLGHHLTVVQMQLQAARAVLASDSARTEELLAKAQGQAEAALAEVRRSVSALREPGTARPLPDSLRGLTEEASAAGVPAELQVAGPARPLPAEAEEALFRAAQEGLTNVRKHARASRASVVLDYRDPAAVAVEVRDDGVGADPRAGTPLGFGLLGAQERAERLGGRLRVDSAPGRGLTLRVEVPG
ncbi:sensor histidine kinase [Georgenia sp. EYE_87]|uniref:sensor histidine kinase n=1 Tax=Georgenia sp. EYE_87 TaxID=2853448 RepID=UPI002005487A|nr:sensor histidine kinase [Georgenia sp. EYE_87]MCK6211406.1 sensor histidine kinase [Georgenia sp. EYE_87]